MKLYIGIDDTDSKAGMCTTYLGVVLKERVEKYSTVEEIRLVRLNPNIPWKTRGNGAVGLVVETNDRHRVERDTLDVVKELSAFEEDGTNPGAVILKEEVKPELSSFYYKALRGIVSIEEATALAEKSGGKVYAFKNGRGVIGSLAAIGADLSVHTHELTAYRAPGNWGRPRKIEPESVHEMDLSTHPHTFNNVDIETSRILIAPRSPCPVLYGIRGDSEEILKAAKDLLRVDEPVERFALFKTNQGTDIHLQNREIQEVRPLSSVRVKGVVVNEPRIIKGGHVVFTIAKNGFSLDCAAFEPTGGFREHIKKLRCGDLLMAYGGVKEARGLTVNLEKLEVLELKESYQTQNPTCPNCKKRMKSSGRGQGFRCRRCKTSCREKENKLVNRELETGLYCVPARAMRHLSKPPNPSFRSL
jgi:tRNA(Ile2)-agmatinylcytidine synthase